MSTRPDDDAPLDDNTWRALKASGDLLPTSEAEVERAEAALPPDLELPESLRAYRPREASPVAVRQLPARRRYAMYAACVGFGALAASAALTLLRPTATPTVTSAGGELVHPSARAPTPRLPLVFRSRCERECCAGSSCKSAPPALASCPSGISCVACTPDNVSGGPYRLRFGSMIATDAGQKVLPLDAPLELCIVNGVSEASCLPALGEPGAAWRQLKTLSPLQDLLTGLSVELRKRGDNTALASWRHPVSPTPELMCKGLAIQLSDGTETLGRLSAFVEPTHFVELARAALVPELLQTLRRFDVSGIEPRIYESSQAGAGRFALVLGPVDKADAEALRWQVLEHGVEARVGYGLDFIGGAHPAQ